MPETIVISRFIDEAGRITQLPRKQTIRRAVLFYLAAKFEPDKSYTEQEVNALCARWHTFGDYFTLRRELVDAGFLGRETNCSRYWRTSECLASPQDEAQPPADARVSPPKNRQA